MEHMYDCFARKRCDSKVSPEFFTVTWGIVGVLYQITG
jgi:hypothetical protein